MVSNRTNHNCESVWYAIKLSNCDDFINEGNIYNNDITLSKGELNRIKVARYMYDVLVDNPSIVFLDEIADGVDSNKTINIANNIYDYFRRNNILCFVTTHLPYLQTLKYDMEINIKDGIVTNFFI